MKRKMMIGAGALLGVVIGLLLVTATIWPVLNSVETGKTPEYPEVLPLYFSADAQRVFDEVEASVGALDGWTVQTSERETLTVRAERTSSLFGFVDDVELTVKPATEFVTVVEAKSSSRVGKGDFGQNARNITDVFEELGRRLGAVKFDPNDLKK